MTVTGFARFASHGAGMRFGITAQLAVPAVSEYYTPPRLSENVLSFPESRNMSASKTCENLTAPCRCVCRDKCAAIPDSAACESAGDPPSSGGRYLARAFRALPC